MTRKTQEWKYMLDKIKNIFSSKKYTGISSDALPVNKWDMDELNLVSASDPFVEVDEITSDTKRRWQASSGSCVAQTCAGMLDSVVGYTTSAVPIYKNRSNKPSPGMSYEDVVKLLPTMRVYSDTDVPSQNKSDGEMDNTPLVGQSSEPKLEPLWITKSFDEVAKAVRNFGRASVWFRGTFDEWQQWVIDDLSSQSNQVRHSVKVIDAVRKDGVEYLVILDSAGYYRTTSVRPDWVKTDGVRLMTREAFNQGSFNQWTAKLINIKQPSKKPVYNFTRTLRYGMLGDKDVKKLQDILIYEGLLDASANTGNYKNMTRSAVKAFQLKYKVASVQEITQLAGMSVGPKTRAKLNQLYA